MNFLHNVKCKRSAYITGKKTADREYFKTGLSKLVECLQPKTIIVYGATPDDIFKVYKDAGIEIISFESEFSKSRKQVVA